MASYDSDRHPYRGRDDEGGERRDGVRRDYGGHHGYGEEGGDRDDANRYDSDMSSGRGPRRQERGWYGIRRDHDERRGDVESARRWYGGRPDDHDRERSEPGGGRYGMSRHSEHAWSDWHRAGPRGDDDDAYSGGPIPRDRDDFGDRYLDDFGDRYGRDARTGHGPEQWRSGVYGGGRGGGYYRYGGAAMEMGAGLERGAGSMAGKGPKGYTRPDERIREDVCDCLTDDPHLDATSIEVQVKNGEVTLSGSVDSRDAKRRAEDLAERASGVKNVQNSLRVQLGGEAGGSGTGPGRKGSTTAGTGSAG